MTKCYFTAFGIQIFDWHSKLRLHYKLRWKNSTHRNFNKFASKFEGKRRHLFLLTIIIHIMALGYISYNFGLVSFSLYNIITTITILYYFKYNSINFHLFTFSFLNLLLRFFHFLRQGQVHVKLEFKFNFKVLSPIRQAWT